MSETDSLTGIREAKAALQGRFGDRAWFRGVGVSRSPDGLRLRLNVDPGVGAEQGEIPEQFRGYGVEVVFIGGYRRHRAPEPTEE